MCTRLPPGFQFVPSDEDLVVHFLRRKASFLPGQHDLVPTLALSDPWELKGRALQGCNNHWYFFARSTENKVTGSGYWEEEDEEGVSNINGDKEVGVKKTFVFRVGKGPEGTKTSWVMHEYHLLERDSVRSCSSSSSSRTRRWLSRKNGQRIMESETWVICRVHHEEDDEDDDDDDNDNAREGYFDDDGTELSFLDEEAFLSLDDDLDEASWPL